MDRETGVGSEDVLSSENTAAEPAPPGPATPPFPKLGCGIILLVFLGALWLLGNRENEDNYPWKYPKGTPGRAIEIQLHKEFTKYASVNDVKVPSVTFVQQISGYLIVSVISDFDNGVFIGVNMSDFLQWVFTSPALTDVHAVTLEVQVERQDLYGHRQLTTTAQWTLGRDTADRIEWERVPFQNLLKLLEKHGDTPFWMYER